MVLPPQPSRSATQTRVNTQFVCVEFLLTIRGKWCFLQKILHTHTHIYQLNVGNALEARDHVINTFDHQPSADKLVRRTR